MGDLPVELITEILLRLPVKTLLRFRCVSKSIRAIIDSCNFINSHLNTTSNDKTHRNLIIREGDLLFGDKDKDTPTHFLVFDIDDGLQQVFDINDFQPELQNFRSYGFFAHCNGLILLGEGINTLGVWNPSIRKYKKLPLLPEEGPSENRLNTIMGFGFGYDSSSDDYKVLLIHEVCYVNLMEDYVSDVHLEIWILGLRSCYWRKIVPFCYDEYRINQNRKYLRNCFVDGAFHFLCHDKILGFDVAKETFFGASLPDFGFGENDGFPLKLQVFEGCLCVDFFSWDGIDLLDLYVRRKDGVDFSWTKLLSTTNKEFSDIQAGRLLGYSKEGDKILILDDEHTLLYSYDVKEDTIHRIVIRVIEGMFDVHVIFCIESLVWIDYQE